MLGGKRENSGRKPISKDLKKKPFTIYLTDKEYKEVNNSKVATSFSKKCIKLIQLALIEENRKKSDSIRFIDLFAGLGGIRIGFEEAFKELGIKTECILTSEIKKSALRAYSNYFKCEDIKGDITKIKTETIPDFDFLLAGFPCQAFSTAGNRLGFDDTRGTLFFEIERILKSKKPYGFILENVEGLITHDKGKTLKIILNTLKNLDYKVTYKVLDSTKFGLAQDRKRIYIVGTKDKEISLDNFIERFSNLSKILEKDKEIVDNEFTQTLLAHYKVEELYGKSIKDKRGGKDNIHSWDIEIKGKINIEQKELLELLLRERRKKKWAEEIGIDWMDGMPLTLEQIKTFYPKENLKDLLDNLVEKRYLSYEYPKKLINKKRIEDLDKEKGYNIITGKLSYEFSKILDPNSVSPTLVATDAHKIGVIDNQGIRKLTVREMQRLFGYPENYDLSFLDYKESVDLLGNTVCIPVVKEISLRLAKILNKEDYSSIRKENYK